VKVLIADDEAFGNVRRERQNPPPHRTLFHRLRRVGDDLAQHVAEHHRRFDIEQCRHLARVICRPYQRRQCPHVMRRVDDGLTAPEADLGDERTALL